MTFMGKFYRCVLSSRAGKSCWADYLVDAVYSGAGEPICSSIVDQKKTYLMRWISLNQHWTQPLFCLNQDSFEIYSTDSLPMWPLEFHTLLITFAEGKSTKLQQDKRLFLPNQPCMKPTTGIVGYYVFLWNSFILCFLLKTILCFELGNTFSPILLH